jgi:hypothetical protein
MQLTVLPGLLVSAMALGASVPALAVEPTSEGTIASEERGLGLAGQTLRLTLSYDPAVVGTTSGNSTLYSGFSIALRVTIGANSGTWNGVADSAFLPLSNNDIITFACGA